MKPASPPKDEAALLEKISAMPVPYRTMGERLHALILFVTVPVARAQRAGTSADRVVRRARVREGRQDRLSLPRRQENMTFGFIQEVNVTPEEGAPHQIIESAWNFNSVDDGTEVKLSAIICKVALKSRLETTFAIGRSPLP